MENTMKILTYIALIAAALSFILGVIARLAGTPIAHVSAVGYIHFLDTCLFAVIAFSLVRLVISKQS